jgi:chromosome segregation ATPase
MDMMLTEEWDKVNSDLTEIQSGIRALQEENAALRAEIKRLYSEQEKTDGEREIENQEWLECQAENARLREALEEIKGHCEHDHPANEIARAALSQSNG